MDRFTETTLSDRLSAKYLYDQTTWGEDGPEPPEQWSDPDELPRCEYCDERGGTPLMIDGEACCSLCDPRTRQRAAEAQGEAEYWQSPGWETALACEDRERIVTNAHSVGELANDLRAHEAVCAECGSTRRTVIDDRLYLNSSGVCCGGKAAA